MNKNTLKLTSKIVTATSLSIYLLLVLVFAPVLIKNDDQGSFYVFLYGYLFLTLIPYSVVGPLFLWNFQVEKRNYNQSLIFSILIIATQIPLISMLAYGVSQFDNWKVTEYANSSHLFIESTLILISSILIIISLLYLIFNKKPAEIDPWDSIVIEIEKRSRQSIKDAREDLQKFKAELK